MIKYFVYLLVEGPVFLGWKKEENEFMYSVQS